MVMAFPFSKEFADLLYIHRMKSVVSIMMTIYLISVIIVHSV